MVEQNWAKDMELCQRAKELIREYGGWIPLDRLEDELSFVSYALEGWPAALKERARLEARVRELEEVLLRICAAYVGSDYDPGANCDCTCGGCEERIGLALEALGITWEDYHRMPYYDNEEQRYEALRRLKEEKRDV